MCVILLALAIANGVLAFSQTKQGATPNRPQVGRQAPSQPKKPPSIPDNPSIEREIRKVLGIEPGETLIEKAINFTYTVTGLSADGEEVDQTMYFSPDGGAVPFAVREKSGFYRIYSTKGGKAIFRDGRFEPVKPVMGRRTRIADASTIVLKDGRALTYQGGMWNPSVAAGTTPESTEHTNLTDEILSKREGRRDEAAKLPGTSQRGLGPKKVAIVNLESVIRSAMEGQEAVIADKLGIAIDRYAASKGYDLILLGPVKPGPIDVDNSVLWLAKGIDLTGFSHSGGATDITQDFISYYKSGGYR